MPLPNNDWAKGKCAFKLIQYMACGVPVVASRVGANIDVVTPNTGFLAGTEEEWIKALSYLRRTPLARNQLGIEGRERIVERYSLEQNIPVLAGVIRKVAQEC
jgi:glycosyltransferase involved in cell wall biosynthesis